jgi:hypothetical protein
MHLWWKSQVSQVLSSHRTEKTRQTVPKGVENLYQIGIWEREGALCRAVQAALERGIVDQLTLHCGLHPAELAGIPLDLLAISPDAGGLAGAGSITCRTVLLPGRAGALVYPLKAGSAVSYGPSPRDTITLSSLEGDQICLALQRELVTVQGGVVERQELVLPFPPGRSSQLYLASVGTLLLLGVSPEALDGE